MLRRKTREERQCRGREGDAGERRYRGARPDETNNSAVKSEDREKKQRRTQGDQEVRGSAFKVRLKPIKFQRQSDPQRGRNGATIGGSHYETLNGARQREYSLHDTRPRSRRVTEWRFMGHSTRPLTSTLRIPVTPFP